MKQFMKKIIYSFILLFLGCGVANAAINGNGLYTFKEGTGAEAGVTTITFIPSSGFTKTGGFYLSTSSVRNDTADKLLTNSVYGGAEKGNVAKVSLRNGTYYTYAFLNSYSYSTNVKFTVSNSCTNGKVSGVTDTPRTIERCLYRDKTNPGPGTSAHWDQPMNGDTIGEIFKCASGYTLDTNSLQISTNCDDPNMTLNVGDYTLAKRFCKASITAKCKKGGSSGGSAVAKPTLSGLSVSEGKLSPAFSAGTKSYKVSVGAGVSSIKVSATASSGNSLVSGYGSRTVKLNYGKNTIKVQVKNSAGTKVTYSIVVTRADNRSAVNTLSNLTVSSGTLSPAFTSGNTNYSLEVGNEVSSITVNATLTDSKSKFASGFGPGSYALDEGVNKIYIKVVSERGATNVYNIVVNRGTIPSHCATDTDNLALLKGIEFAVDMEGVEIDQLGDEFDSKIFNYAEVKVPYKVSTLVVKPYVFEEGDEATVDGNLELEVNEPSEIRVTVKSKTCPNYTNVYTFNVVRQPEISLGTDAELRDLEIEGYKIDFEPNEPRYSIKLKKGDDKLKIKYTKVDPNASCTEEGNENLGYDSEIKILCTSADGENTADYYITIDGVDKGANVFLIILLVIIIIVILIYLVLRMLGYRIYFNTAAIGAFFRGMGEKAKDSFDK